MHQSQGCNASQSDIRLVTVVYLSSPHGFAPISVCNTTVSSYDTWNHLNLKCDNILDWVGKFSDHVIRATSAIPLSQWKHIWYLLRLKMSQKHPLGNKKSDIIWYNVI